VKIGRPRQNGQENILQKFLLAGGDCRTWANFQRQYIDSLRIVFLSLAFRDSVEVSFFSFVE